MRIVITGHTSGVGKEIYDHYVASGHDVVGLSRSTGYNVYTDQDAIVDIVSTADVFFNNYSGETQIELLEKTVNKVSKIVVLGSAMRLFRDIATDEYIEEKYTLSNKCKMLSINPSISTKILHLGVSFLPHNRLKYSERMFSDKRMVSDNVVEYNELLGVVDYWIKNPVFNDVTFNWKLSSVVLMQMKTKFPNLSVNIF
jgi:hypothetical protein